MLSTVGAGVGEGVGVGLGSGVGVACGAGQYAMAIHTTVLAFLILTIVSTIEQRANRLLASALDYRDDASDERPGGQSGSAATGEGHGDS